MSMHSSKGDSVALFHLMPVVVVVKVSSKMSFNEIVD